MSVVASKSGSKVKCPKCGEVLDVVASPVPPKRKPAAAPPPLPPAAPSPVSTGHKSFDPRILRDLIALLLISAPVIAPIFAGIALREPPYKPPHLHEAIYTNKGVESSNITSNGSQAITPTANGGSVAVSPADMPQRQPPAKGLRAPTHRVPFISKLSKTDEGELPDGWIGDSSIGVRRRGPQHWFENAADNPAMLRPPRLFLPDQFELVIDTDVGNAGLLEIVLEDESSRHSLVLTIRKSLPREISLTYGQNEHRSFYHDLGGRIRLVRDKNVYRVINGDEIVVERLFKEFQPNGELAFRLSGQKPFRLYSIAVLPFGPTASNPPVSRFYENFLLVPEGELPPEWRGDPAVGARVSPKYVALTNADSNAGQVATPHLVFPTEFVLTCLFDLHNHASARIRLLGSKSSPDVVTSIKRDSSPEQWETDFTGGNRRTDRSSGPGPALIKIVHQRETFSLSLNGTKIYAHRLPDHRDFVGIEFGLSGSDYPASLKEVSLALPGEETSNPERKASPRLNSTPSRSPKPKNLTGRWNVDPTTRIDLEELEGKVKFRLGASIVFSVIAGTAELNDGTFTGQLQVVHRADRNATVIRVPITAKIADLNLLEVKLKVPKFNRGRWNEGTWSEHIWTRLP
jgi:hypothetical protein